MVSQDVFHILYRMYYFHPSCHFTDQIFIRLSKSRMGIIDCNWKKPYEQNLLVIYACGINLSLSLSKHDCVITVLKAFKILQTKSVATRNTIAFTSNSLQNDVTFYINKYIILTMSASKQLNLHLCYAMWHSHIPLLEFVREYSKYFPLNKIIAKKLKINNYKDVAKIFFYKKKIKPESLQIFYIIFLIIKKKEYFENFDKI